MQSNYITRSFRTIGLGLLMTLAIVAFSSVEAKAQWGGRDDGRWGRNGGGILGAIFGGGGNNNMRSIARERGYRDGQDVGREQSRDGRRYDPSSSSRYRNATNGYEGWMRNREAYRNAYRRTFEQGYRDGYGRYGRGGNNRRGGWGW